MNIYKFEINRHMKSTLLWSLVVAIFIFLYMSLYPSMSSDAQALDDLLSEYPPELLAAFGMDSANSLATVLGFLSFVFVFAQLAIAIQASNYAFSIISIEETELTADFLMSKPVTRNKIFFSKLFAVITCLSIVNIVAWLSTFSVVILFNNGNDYDMSKVIVLLSSVILFQLFFLSIGMLVSVCVKKIRSVLPYSIALAVGMYVLSIIEGLVGVDKFKFLTAFSYFSPAYILENGSYDIILLLLDIVLTIGAFIACYFLYQKRNISSV